MQSPKIRLRSISSTSIALSLAAAMIPGALSAAGAAAVTESTVHDFPAGPAKEGASTTLIRNNAGVTATFLSSDLTAGDVYTFWWVIFNSPENCSAPCGLDDVAPFPGNAAAGVSLVYGSGQVIPTSGQGNFAAHLGVGDTTGAMFGPGLIDPLGSEIHFVLRTHGPPIQDQLNEQLSSFGGGCGVNTCANEISSEHRPLTDQAAVELQAIRALLERVAVRLGLRP